MFDLGWSELLVIGVVALIVVGPKDLPVLFRRVGQFVGKARGMAREFSRAMEQAADEAGVKETAKSLKSIADPKKMGLDAVKDATRDVTDSFKGWNPDSETGKLLFEADIPGMSATKPMTYRSDRNGRQYVVVASDAPHKGGSAFAAITAFALPAK